MCHVCVFWNFLFSILLSFVILSLLFSQPVRVHDLNVFNATANTQNKILYIHNSGQFYYCTVLVCVYNVDKNHIISMNNSNIHTIDSSRPHQNKSELNCESRVKERVKGNMDVSYILNEIEIVKLQIGFDGLHACLTVIYFKRMVYWSTFQ